MNGFEYIVAKDFDRAWLNFELDLPLKPGKNGEPNPFYVNRPAQPDRRTDGRPAGSVSIDRPSSSSPGTAAAASPQSCCIC